MKSIKITFLITCIFLSISLNAQNSSNERIEALFKSITLTQSELSKATINGKKFAKIEIYQKALDAIKIFAIEWNTIASSVGQIDLNRKTPKPVQDLSLWEKTTCDQYRRTAHKMMIERTGSKISINVLLKNEFDVAFSIKEIYFYTLQDMMIAKSMIH